MRGLCLFALLGLLGAAAAEATTPLRRPEDPPVAPALPRAALPERTAAPEPIPILALYTPERLAASGGLAALTAELADELAALNDSLLVSGIRNYDFVFSAVEPAAYHDSGVLGTDLQWLRDNWPASRVTQAGARLVHLFVGDGDLGGISGGFTPPYPSVSNRPPRAQAGRFVLAHEVGHNLGLSHDRENVGPFPPPWANGLGFRMAGYRDVMALSNGCFELFGDSCPVFAGFSDPARTRDGVPLGVPGESEAVAVLRETLPVMAGDATCAASPQALCLESHRFQADIFWFRRDGAIGHGRAVPLTADSGLFWFFSPANIEVIVKVLDGCAVNGHRWVFAGGLTDVGVALSVTDTVTGAIKVYVHEAGRPYQPLQDVAAFPCQ